MMLELLLTRREDRALVAAAQGLKFLVFDELHTYRGRQGADVALLIRRCRLAFGGHDFICVGTSATMATEGTTDEQKRVVANVPTKMAPGGWRLAKTRGTRAFRARRMPTCICHRPIPGPRVSY